MFAGLEDFFREVQKLAEPSVWSRGVTLIRSDASVICDSANADEVRLRLLIQNQPISPRVKLFPIEQQWVCDCGGDDDPCAHVAASLIALKQGKVSALDAESATSPTVARVDYRFRTVALPPVTRWGQRMNSTPAESLPGLVFDRYIVDGARETRLTQNLRAYGAGVQTGRVPGVPVAASKSDFAIDMMIANPSDQVVDRLTLLNLLRGLESFENVTLDGQPVKTSSVVIGVTARLVDDGEGWRLFRFQKLQIDKKFFGGFVLTNGRIHPVEHSKLTPDEDKLLTQVGEYFAPSEGLRLASEILPVLQRKINVEILSERLPRTVKVPPQILIATEALSNNELSVVARLVYAETKDLPLAYVQDMRLTRLAPPGKNLRDAPMVVIERDEALERQLLQKLSRELQLQTGRPVSFRNQDAIDFAKRLQGWQTEGRGLENFTTKPMLAGRIEVNDRRVKLVFCAESEGRIFEADAAKVFIAFRNGEETVPLIDGGWAPLPKDWLKRFGKPLQEMLAARDQKGELPAHRMPELAKIFESTGQEAPEFLKNLRKMLDHFEGIKDYSLPEDLTATLRKYQRVGVNWLCFLRESDLGGMLADDMGLGKTLQAICAIRGRTLVVAPTSVLHNWAAELSKFRPGLKTSVYHGADRKLSMDADVVLTTYAIARIDQDQLAAQSWQTMIIDEAQSIKNPQSQVARAIHRFQSKFRISLSGTPVENRLDDLWSQFQFVNPGFLGTHESFLETYARPISRGDLAAAESLRAKVKPFILRRLKKEVAPELPARTESVLRCELGTDERNVYESILAATRSEVVAKIREGGSVLMALEALLRLRQACCHRALVPGQTADTSSKLDLLFETLEESLSEGHRSLIFSQWTSFLDLIQQGLAARQISYSRIDGGTKNRAEIVHGFQQADGPPVMLLSLKAGGVGLTLTAADHVFIMDPWWNPSVEDQAADRAHRIGQQNPVLIHRLVAAETLEEKILLLQQKKKDLARSVLDGGEGGASITREDLLELLS